MLLLLSEATPTVVPDAEMEDASAAKTAAGVSLLSVLKKPACVQINGNTTCPQVPPSEPIQLAPRVAQQKE